MSLRDVHKLEGEIALELPGDRLVRATYEMCRDGSMTIKFKDGPVAEAILDITLEDRMNHLTFGFVYREKPEEG
jgi:hypothetical protein